MRNPWAESVEAHRRDRREAILDAAAAIVAESGLSGVTMSRIAMKAGIAQARLHWHFSNLDEIMRAWHDRQLANHLAYLDDLGAGPGTVLQRIDTVLRAYAAILHQTHQHHATELGASLHRAESLVDAHRRLHDLVRTLLAEGVASGDIHEKTTPDELAADCLRTLSSAGDHSSSAAIRQLVTTMLAQLRPSSATDDKN